MGHLAGGRGSLATMTGGDPVTQEFRGIYDPPEAARYLRAGSPWTGEYPLDPLKIARWIRRGLASSSLRSVPGRELLLDFHELISMRVIIALRAEGVTWREIQQTEDWFPKARGLEMPFATEFFWTGQGNIFAGWADRLVSESRHGQAALDLLCEYVMPVNGLLFDEATGLATLWEPRDGVTLEPLVQFGAPCIKGTRIPTRSIYGMIQAGDSPDRVARSYGIGHEELQATYNWESALAA